MRILGFLREAYVVIGEDGNAVVGKDGKEVIDYRCAAEPVANYVKKGGKLEDTLGRLCLCNGLMATIGLGQNLARPAGTSGNYGWRYLKRGDSAASRYLWAELLGR